MEFSMPTLVIHAPWERENKPTPNYKSFESIFASNPCVGPDYAIPRDLFTHLYPGCGVVLLCKDKPRRAEGKLVKLDPTFKAGNAMQRYNVYIDHLTMVPYKPENLTRSGVWPHLNISSQSGVRIRGILANVKSLAVEYYRLTGRPLGVTGEVAERVAAELLGLKLRDARTVGFDALRGTERIQIKGRAYGEKAKPGQRISRMKRNAPCDTVLLVLLDNLDLEVREMWEAPYASVCECLERPGSKARERGALSVSEFKRIPRVRCVWPEARSVPVLSSTELARRFA
jgi:hypothetical protein